ncbi:MAG: YciI family protein [bacterium]
MKYLCMAYEEESKLNALSKSEWDVLRTETMTYVNELKKGGYLITAEPLQSVRTAATVRVRGGKVAITDGPFAETKETLGGIFIINVRDQNEAIQIASKWPSARFGSIEVRPLEEGLREDRRYV